MPDVAVVAKLKALCDFLKNFSIFVQNLNETSIKHNMPLHEIKNFGSFNQNSLEVLTESMTPEKLGQTIIAMGGIQKLGDGLRNFTNYDTKELAEFAANLEDLVKKFEEALE